ncbi:MAG TPA: hypothetical protein PLB01_09435 [Thermoanaerobaculia bacterium]|nr:hypothetical protein [Thermoanaerobaculia bacterium]
MRTDFLLRIHALLLVAFVAAASAAAQEPPKKGKAFEPPPEPERRWELTLGGAGGFASSSRDVDAAFGAAGYTPSSSGDFLSATVFPSIRFRLGERAAVGVSFSSTKLGSTTGTGFGTSVSIGRSSTDVALVAFWRPFPGLRVGAGPAWYRLTAAPDVGESLEVSKLGWIAEAGLAYPDRGAWYVDLAVQYRGTGDADFGTYVPSAKGPIAPAPISLDGIGCEHGAFLAGIGFRF